MKSPSIALQRRSRLAQRDSPDLSYHILGKIGRDPLWTFTKNAGPRRPKDPCHSGAMPGIELRCAIAHL